MGDTPKWIPVLFGSMMVLMGSLILGAVVGVVPTDGGRFLAPSAIIVALGLGLILGGLLLWVPENWPPLIRSALFLVALGMMGVVCNWTAFAPEVVYSTSTSTSIGPVMIGRESDIGGRIVFGLAAILLDVVILLGLIRWARSIFLRGR